MVFPKCSPMLVLLACAGATPDPGPAPPADDAGAFAAALAEVGSGSRPCTDLMVAYVDGNGLDGWTHVDVESGRVSVRRTHPGADDTSFSGELEEAECRDLARGAADGKLWTVRSEREFGVPDETRPEIRIGVTGAGSFSVQVWANDADDLAPFGEARKRILALASRVSGGAVTY